MYTQCPNCETLYRVDAGEIKIGRGQIKCGKCNNIFDALSSLGESIAATGSDDYGAVPELDESQTVHAFSIDDPEMQVDGSIPWAHPVPAKSLTSQLLWSFGSLSLIALFGIQLFAAYSDSLLNNAALRARLVETCAHLDCQLPLYRNIAAIDVVDHEMFRKSEQVLQFQLSLANNSAFQQPLPPIQLTLLSFTGDTMATRVFKLGEYTSNDSIAPLMPSRKSIEVSIKIAKPDQDIGGYQFKLMET